MGPRAVAYRVVLDTNVFVSALLFGGRASELVSHWQMGAIVPLVSRAIVLEYQQVLAYPKFELSAQEIRVLMEGELLPYAEVVEVTQTGRYVERGPSDDKFIGCALVGKARYIVSGDRHLLDLRRRKDVSIVTVAHLLDELA